MVSTVRSDCFWHDHTKGLANDHCSPCGRLYLDMRHRKILHFPPKRSHVIILSRTLRCLMTIRMLTFAIQDCVYLRIEWQGKPAPVANIRPAFCPLVMLLMSFWVVQRGLLSPDPDFGGADMLVKSTEMHVDRLFSVLTETNPEFRHRKLSWS